MHLFYVIMKLFASIKAWLELLRPLEWSKTLAGMIFGALLALFAGLIIPIPNFLGLPNIILFIIGFVIAGPLLWGGLYTLNDLSDIEKDKQHSIKKNRPLPSGRIKPLHAWIVSIAFVLIALILGFFINIYFFICLLAMLFNNQVLYSAQPFRFKERLGFDLVSGSMINPLFRFLAGFSLFASSFFAPILFILFVVGIQFGGYTLYRLSGKKVEKQLGYKSTVVLVPEKIVKSLAYSGIAISILAFIAMILLPLAGIKNQLLGFLPLRFAWLVILSAFLVPFYLKALKDPQHMDMKRIYRLIYYHNLLFLLGFVILFVVDFSFLHF